MGSLMVKAFPHYIFIRLDIHAVSKDILIMHQVKEIGLPNENHALRQASGKCPD